MIQITSKFFLFVSMTIVASCAATDVANRYYADERYSAVPSQQVRLLTKPPLEPYTVIAEFQSRREAPRSVREKAAAIGADAVIITLYGGQHSLDSEWASDERNMAKTFTRIVGIAIKMDKEG